MKNKMIVVMIFLLSVGVVAADFSGTWVLNREKSELGEGRGARMAATKLVVEQKENTLAIESTRTGRDDEERVTKEEMTLDGKETKSSTEWADAVSTAKINGEVLIIAMTRTFERNGETFEMKSEQKWALDNDGKILVIDLKSESPRGERVMKLVYDFN